MKPLKQIKKEKKMDSKTLRAWIKIQCLYKHPVFHAPILLGTAIAWSQKEVLDWRIVLISVIVSYFFANGSLISNEYFDYENDCINEGRIGGDEEVSFTTTGGTKVLVEGLLPKKHALIVSLMFYAAGIPLGILLQFYYKTGSLTIPLGILAASASLFYTAPPIKAVYRGFGEIFLCTGLTVPVLIGYYIHQGFSWYPLIIALPWIVATPAGKIIREFPDYEADKSTNKRNLVVIFGREKMTVVYILLMICSLILQINSFFIIGEKKGLLLLLPAFFIIRSVIPMVKGEWKIGRRIDAIASDGFIGMFLVAASLIVIFVLKGLHY
jgi:1,4-dihydroxy-2-naphthoate octaprenyltransferase